MGCASSVHDIHAGAAPAFKTTTGSTTSEGGGLHQGRRQSAVTDIAAHASVQSVGLQPEFGSTLAVCEPAGSGKEGDAHRDSSGTGPPAHGKVDTVNLPEGLAEPLSVPQGDVPSAHACQQAPLQSELTGGPGEAPPTALVQAMEEGTPPPASVRTLLLPEPKSSVDVTARGVTLDYLCRLAESSEVDADWTIQEVVDKFVRPSSRAAKTCLFDLVPSEHTGQPRYFISHTWSRKLSALLGMLREHLSEEAVFIWLDIVAINQNPYEDRGCLLNEDVANLSKVVHATEQTLFCLDVECVALTRIWCLYEVWQTFLSKGVAGFVVLMSAGVQTEVLREAFETFNISNARATQEQDKEDILGKIRLSDVKATQINLQLKAALVDSAALAAKAAGEAAAGVQPQLLARAAQMLDANGRYGEAEPLLRQALQARLETLGEGDPDTISSSSNLAKCLISLGRPAEAEPILLKVLDARRRVLGAGHAASLSSLSELAKCVSTQGRWAEAEPMYQESLEGRRALGAEHCADAVSSVNDLAICLQKLRRHAEAEPMYRQAFAEAKDLLGPDNRQTIGHAANLAGYLSERGHHAEAEKLYVEALEAWERVLGPSHPSTISAMRSLAICINAQGRFVEAELAFTKALDMRTAVLGPDHPSTTNLRADLAICVMEQGRYADAEPLLRQAFAERMLTPGPDHQDTIACLNHLARCVKKQGHFPEAEELYRELLATTARVCGSDHRSTGDCMHNLGLLLGAMGRGEDAAAFLASAAEVYAHAST